MKKKQYLENNWRHKSIETLEKNQYGDPNDAPTPMVKRCLGLCRIPLDEFTIDDLRLMIGQAFALPFLITLALEHLHKDVFVEGLYPGDLIGTVLNIDPKFWLENESLWREIFELIKDKRAEFANYRIHTMTFDSVF